jgi:hypothetical protein
MDDSHFWMLLYMICILKGQLITAAASMVFGCKSSIFDKNLMLSFTFKKIVIYNVGMDFYQLSGWMSE